MDIEKVEITENTIDLNLQKILESQNKETLLNASISNNVWLPDNYDNLVKEAFGKTHIKVPGNLIFHFTQQTLLSLPFQNNTFSVDISIQSKNLLSFQVECTNEYTIEKTNTNETVYHVTFRRNENNKLIVSVPCEDIISWKITFIT